MQDRSQGFEQEWRFDSRCRRALATKKVMQKAWRRLTDFVGHPQIEAEPLQNQSGSLLECSEAIWDRPLMFQGRLTEAPGCSWDASSRSQDASGTSPGQSERLQERLGDVPGRCPNVSVRETVAKAQPKATQRPFALVFGACLPNVQKRQCAF